MTEYKIGDSVIGNGYPGTIIAIHAHGIDVRLASGVVCLDPADGQSVQPHSIWPLLLKIAASDLKRARKEGSILIAETRRNTVELTYDAAAKQYECQTCEGHFVFKAAAKQATEHLASLYQTVSE